MNIDAVKILLEGSHSDGVDCTSADVKYGSGSEIEVETGLFLYGLLRRYNPRVGVETGTHRGYSSAWLALAMKDAVAFFPGRRPGVLFTVDVGEYEGEPEDLWQKLGLSNIHHHIGDSLRFQPPIAPIDFLWLDADHGTEFIVNEWEHFKPWFNPHKMMVGFHDTRLDVREGAAVKEIFQQHMPGHYRHGCHLPMRNMRGLDLIFLTNEEL